MTGKWMRASCFYDRPPLLLLTLLRLFLSLLRCLVVHISNNQSGINGWCRRQRVETRTHGNYKRNGRKYEKREKEERNKLM